MVSVMMVLSCLGERDLEAACKCPLRIFFIRMLEFKQYGNTFVPSDPMTRRYRP